MSTGSLQQQVFEAADRDDLGRAEAIALAHLDSAPPGEALHAMALVEAQSGRLIEAAGHLKLAIGCQPDRASWYRDLGIVEFSNQRWSEAAAAFQNAIERDPEDSRSWLDLARSRTEAGESQEACLALAECLDLDSRSRSAHAMMARAHRQSKQHAEASRHEEEVVRLDPEDFGARGRLAADCWMADDLPGALRHSGVVVDHGSASAELHAFHLYLRLFDPAQSGGDLRAAYEEWARRHCPAEAADGPVTDPDPDKRLRIGYISAEFSGGPPLFFLAPILAGHDPQQVEVYLYHSSRMNDSHTDWFRKHADQWRDCSGQTDSVLLETIRADHIDILIDPSGYSRDHRLRVLARRAAPIQITYPNYPSTRGIRQIDYILTDRWATPEGTEEHYVEAPLRLPSGSIVYVPPPDAPSVTALPARRHRYITYGLFQRRVKLNGLVLDAVAEVLVRTPDARLLVQHIDPDLDRHGSRTRTSLLREFLSRGIPESRLRLVGSRPRAKVMSLMAETDIALDTFPFGGHTTTCECLWMGVPVVTFSGASHASRISSSILNSIGLPEFVAQTQAGYVETAIDAATGVRKLAELRRSMRTRMRRAGVVDSPRISREIEAALRQVWRKWCADQMKNKENLSCQ